MAGYDSSSTTPLPQMSPDGLSSLAQRAPIPESSSGLKLTFTSEGADDLVEFVRTGDQARRTALRLITGLDTLRDGDVLKVEKHFVNLIDRMLG